ncbi:MarR family transcriptional regulator [Actinopolymorpha alba]|uniref:MarR family transcriptional regulator n=1 Tax=Actinopolymorpha alba TaxID=533267 RepID=UPI000368D221|nr:MarR family transcriptional regulator [Actinopolymorpha alba]
MASQSEKRCLLGQIEAALSRFGAASARTDHLDGAEAGLTLSTCEANFLNLLVLHGPLSPGQLGQRSGIGSSGTITGTIDRLERAGYVRRVRCVDDRRKVVIELADEHLAHQSCRSRRVAAIARGYTTEQLTVVAEFLDRLAEAESEPAAAQDTSRATKR